MHSRCVWLPTMVNLFSTAMLLTPGIAGQGVTTNSTTNATSPSSAAQAAVPRLIKFSGTLLDGQNRPMAGPVGLTFALYAQESGGAALWMETQNVHPDASGNYIVLLGAASKDGLPADQFSSGEARWLGIQVENRPEQARILLVSVPYALKAHDAETLGGLPPSAFLSTTQAAASNSTASSGSTVSKQASANTIAPAVCTFNGAGTANFIPLWTGACSQINSLFFQASSGNVGLSTTSPAAKLDVEAPATDATGVQAVTPSTAFFAAAMFGHATGATGVTRGVYGVADSSAGIGVHGIAATGGQFETGSSTGNILVGRGLGSTRFTISPLGNVHTTGNLRVDGGVSVGGSGLVQVDAPSIPGGRLTVIANGNVGINNPSPTNRLMVIGNNVAGAAAIVGQAAPAAIPGTGVQGTAGADGTGVAGTATVPGGCGGLELCSAVGVSGTASGSTSNIGVSGSVTGGGVGVQGFSDNASGFGVQGNGPNTGVQGVAKSNAFFAAGVWGNASATTGVTRGVYGTSSSSGGIGVHGIAFIGGQFETGNSSGAILIGRGLGFTRFRVDPVGKVFADGGFQTGGADFAESFAVRGDRRHYEAGDLLAIDRDGARRMALAQEPYSHLVAGIYSTKPGLLGTPHTMFDPELDREVPMAVVGVVPCKVTAENGPITAGDLLVSSSRPGYAMKGTNRKRMLGAVVGKALEPLPSGKGTILVLVTLQ